jgi:hypothetical protein
MYLSSWQFDSQVTVQSVATTYNGVGSTNVWTDGDTVWCICMVMTGDSWLRANTQYNQRFTTTQIYRIVTRERVDYKFDSSRFIWHSPTGDRIMKPIRSAAIGGGVRDQFTWIDVEDITDVDSA